MKQLSVEKIANICHGVIVGNSSNIISEILTDSRRLFVANRTIFIALVGSRHDGHQYVDDLYRRGMRNFICQRSFSTNNYPNATFILVDDTLLALQQIALYNRQCSHANVLAICGSNGKTIVKEWLSELIGNHLFTVRSPRSYNSQVGVPLSLLNIEENTQLAIIETGISQVGEMSRLQNIIRPDDVIITNIGSAHQENFPSLDVKLKEKLNIATHAKRIFFCADQTDVAAAIRRRFPTAELVGWGSQDYVDYVVSYNDKGVNIAHHNNTYFFPFSLTDDISRENISHALVYALACGIAPSSLAENTKNIVPIDMRLEQKEAHNGCTLIDDSYNADITSTEVALDYLHLLGDKKGLSRTVILSDLQQTGLPDGVLYRRVAKLLLEKNVSRLIGIGKAISSAIPTIFEELKANISYQLFDSTDSFLSSMSTADFHSEAILLKGQRRFAFEKISLLLESALNRTIMKVNLSALAHNIAYFRSYLKPSTKLLAMVKAYSYGTGSFEIAKLMQQQGVDYLGVAFADEGVDLRNAGITLPIIVMNPEVHSFDTMLKYDLEPQIFGFEELREYANAVWRNGISSAPVHIKFNTGMTRSGFEVSEAAEVGKQLRNEYSRLKVVSAFSHLVESEDPTKDNATLGQIDAFVGACNVLSDILGYKFIRHILNSAGIERFSEHQLEMVRLGIGLYGLSAVDNSRLRNVVTLRSYISLVRHAKAGDTVGYNRRTVLSRNSHIAIVPIGYADGVDRRLSNGVGKVLIRGQFVPIVGNVCMDIIMVDVTDIVETQKITPEELLGQTVELFGDTAPVWDMAKNIGTIGYEILTGIGRRVKRIYFVE